MESLFRLFTSRLPLSPAHQKFSMRLGPVLSTGYARVSWALTLASRISDFEG